VDNLYDYNYEVNVRSCSDAEFLEILRTLADTEREAMQNRNGHKAAYYGGLIHRALHIRGIKSNMVIDDVDLDIGAVYVNGDRPVKVWKQKRIVTEKSNTKSPASQSAEAYRRKKREEKERALDAEEHF
jgi:hypothetical protein